MVASKRLVLGFEGKYILLECIYFLNYSLHKILVSTSDAFSRVHFWLKLESRATEERTWQCAGDQCYSILLCSAVFGVWSSVVKCSAVQCMVLQFSAV